MAKFFYKEFGELGYLSSYSPHGFYANELYWATVEHYYQAQKFFNREIQEHIRLAPTPKEASTIGRDRNLPLRSDWEEVKEKVMYDAVLLKFKSHRDIALKLINTGNECIIEETVKESFWGCGPYKDGKNVFGKILCLVRKELEKEIFGIKKYYISEKGYKNLYEQYLEIDREIIMINKQLEESVKRDTDLRGNPELMQLRVKAMYELPYQKEELWNKYEHAIIIENMNEYKNFDGNMVIRGCTVLLRLGDEEVEYLILGTDEGDIDTGIISCSEPIAEAILNQNVGDRILFNDFYIGILKVWI